MPALFVGLAASTIGTNSVVKTVRRQAFKVHESLNTVVVASAVCAIIVIVVNKLRGGKGLAFLDRAPSAHAWAAIFLALCTAVLFVQGIVMTRKVEALRLLPFLGGRQNSGERGNDCACCLLSSLSHLTHPVHHPAPPDPIPPHPTLPVYLRWKGKARTLHAPVAAVALADLGYLLYLGIAKTKRPRLALFSLVPFVLYLAHLGLRMLGRTERGVGGIRSA